MNKWMLIFVLFSSSSIAAIGPEATHFCWSHNGVQVDGFKIKCSGLKTATILEYVIRNPAAICEPFSSIIKTEGAYFCTVNPFNSAGETKGNPIILLLCGQDYCRQVTQN